MNGVIFRIGENEVRLPICKRLSKDEKDYLKFLHKSIDGNIQYTLKWLDTDESLELLDMDEDDFDDAFVNSNLYRGLNNLFLESKTESKKYVSKFYNKGSKLGYADIGKILPFKNSDEKALNILNNYVGDLVYNVNVECGIGIQDVLMLGAMGTINVNEIKENILNVPYVPVRSNISVSSRCDMVARTEYGRAINTGVLQAYSNSGVTEVNINTTGLSNVCEDCLDLERDNPYTIEEAMALLPLHPQCACSYSPINGGNGDVENPMIIDLT